MVSDIAEEAPPPTSRRGRGEVLLRIAFIVAFVYICADFFVPVVLGGVVAVMLFPVHAKLRGSLGRFSRLSPGIVTLGALLVLAGPLTLLGWKASAAAVDVLAGTSLTGIVDFGERQLQRVAQLFGMNAGGLEALRTSLADAATTVSSTVGRALATAVRTLPGYLAGLFLFTLVNYYGLRDGERFVAWIRRISPADPEESEALLAGMHRAIRGAVMGMLVVGLVQGGICMLVLLALKVPGAILWGVVAMLASVVPLVGTAPVTVGAAVYLFAMDRPVAAGVMLATGVVVGVADNLIRPYLQSSHDEIHPLIAILSIFGGLVVLGVSGLFIGPVVAAMALWAIATWRTPTTTL